MMPATITIEPYKKPKWTKALICRLIGHRWRFKIVSLEGHKIWICRRCGKESVGRWVGHTPR